MSPEEYIVAAPESPIGCIIGAGIEGSELDEEAIAAPPASARV